MNRRVSLSAKLVRIGVALLVLALASIGVTLWVTWQLEGGAAAVNEAGRMRMQTWRLTSGRRRRPAPRRWQCPTGLNWQGNCRDFAAVCRAPLRGISTASVASWCRPAACLSGYPRPCNLPRAASRSMS